MDYEQKYKEALTWMKGNYVNLSHEQQMEVEAFFPELKESNDERIRKELTQLISCTHDADNRTQRWLNWLEKQKDYEAELERAFKTADEVQYRRGYEDAKREFEKQGESDINPSEFDLRLNKLLKQFENLPKEELTNSLSFYLNIVQKQRNN